MEYLVAWEHPAEFKTGKHLSCGDSRITRRILNIYWLCPVDNYCYFFFQLKILFFLFSNLEFDFVAFCGFFPDSLTVFNRGRQLKSSRAGQQNNFFIFWLHFSILKKITLKCNKTSCCIVAWSRLTFWFKLDCLLPKN